MTKANKAIMYKQLAKLEKAYKKRMRIIEKAIGEENHWMWDGIHKAYYAKKGIICKELWEELERRNSI